MARKENDHILLLPPLSSHILQPLDLCIIKSLKSAWDPDLVKWQKHHNKKVAKKGVSKMITSPSAAIAEPQSAATGSITIHRHRHLHGSEVINSDKVRQRMIEQKKKKDADERHKELRKVKRAKEDQQWRNQEEKISPTR
ncbi:hypothetical protein JTB14_019689 [Gonioctena quinquepunctata]|nr:hypothetical protein JTB14_019689 [Gonioctena quinquepunctata]